MSYLNALRLHFAGRFQANVSTVNNDPAHFDNAAFKSSYQKPQDDESDNGWFNPQGDAAWRFLGCKVTAAWMPTGAVSSGDPVLGYIVADTDGRVPAKLADLDSEQQLVSEIWGLQVRIADTAGNTLMRGDFDPAAFADIWDRATGSGGGDIGAGAMYQSVLTNLQWCDVSASPFLSALRQAARTGLLSIKFNVDGFNGDNTSPDFMTGRIAGTIGPATASEPRHMVVGRQFMATTGPNGNFFTPLGAINFCSAVVDETASCIYLDLGNALSTAAPGGAINPQGDLTLSIYDPTSLPGDPAGTTGTTVAIGVIPESGAGGYVQNPNWYANTAGVVALPLSPAQLQAVASSPLRISGNAGVLISEWSSSAFVRADQFVYRMSPDETVQIPVYAMQFGKPLAGVGVNFKLDPSHLQPTNGFPYVAPGPAVAVPEYALAFNPTAVTDSNGRAVLTLNTSDPGTPRFFNNGTDYGIDGQVYGIRPAFSDAQTYTGPVNQWNFISILLWSGFTPANPVTWTDIQPIFQQYANLYPVMNRFLDLGNYDAVVKNTRLLLLAFGLNPSDPNSMPVTRDLSPAKRNAILAWLKNPLPGEVRARANTADIPEPAVGNLTGLALPKGGKAAAAARRMILRKQ
jgi:hypothetical protein